MGLVDHHTHSSFSADSTCDLREYFILAKEENIKYVSTCEHVDLATFDGSDWLADFSSLKDYANKLSAEFDIKYLLGIEVGYKFKYLERLNSIVNSHDFDIIQLSIHDNNIYDYYFKEAFNIGITKALNEYFELILEALDNFSNFDSLSHIDFAFKTAKMIDSDICISEYESYLIKIFNKLISLNKSFEINCKCHDFINEINNDYSHTIYLLNLYKKCLGTKLTLSSDAHSSDKYRFNFSLYQRIIKECGFKYINYYIKRIEYQFEL